MGGSVVYIMAVSNSLLFDDEVPLPTNASVPHHQDFAGSGVVHVTGGTIALVGTALLGPRRGRFIRNGNKLVPSKTSHLGHSVPLVGLGTFILFFGFLAFNGGSALTYPSTNSSAKIAQVSSGRGGGGAVFFFFLWLDFAQSNSVRTVGHDLNGAERYRRWSLLVAL